jgi:hypothetical protein
MELLVHVRDTAPEPSAPARCSAPKILSAAPCRRLVARPGTGVCVRHLGTDPARRCDVEVRDRSGNRVDVLRVAPGRRALLCGA